MYIIIRNTEDLLDVLEPFSVDVTKYDELDCIYQIAAHRAHINIGYLNSKLFLEFHIAEYTTGVCAYYILRWNYSVEEYLKIVKEFGFTPNYNKPLGCYMVRPDYVSLVNENQLFEILINLIYNIGTFYNLK